ncbi:MAG: hypothetical protein ICV68_01725 [Pyrinomonadaceae bacterium]|nr:hypothetical protein [Pyrinomonadaceae bacterium]
MKNCFAKSNVALLLVLLALSLCIACKNSANVSVSNSNSNTTRTNSVSSNQTTTNTEATLNKSTSSGSTTDLHTPAEDSAERKAILDAVRVYLKSKQDFGGAVFDEVETLNVSRGWAFIATNVSAPDNSPYGLVEALLQEQNGRWRVLEIFEYDGSNEKGQWEAFKARYKDAPGDIFPPRG